MRSRLLMGIAAVLMTILASGVQLATAGEPGRLAALTARQGLRDEVCVAMADGHISPAERYSILTYAKTILKPEEYEGLKRSMDRLSPPKPSPAKRSTQTAANGSPRTVSHRTPPMVESPSRPTIPSGAILPDRMASASNAR
jgi:hypothetical protein